MLRRPPDVFVEEIRTARFTHHCCECEDSIFPKAKYQFVKGLWDGSWSRYRTCLRCADLRELACINTRALLTEYFSTPVSKRYLLCRPDDCEPCFGELVEWLQEREFLTEESDEDELSGEAVPTVA